MSSWEYTTHVFMDNNQRVIKWSSEPFGIPYFNPVKQRPAKYFPDYYCEYIDNDGVIHKQLIELKPLAQVAKPSNRGSHKTRMYANLTHMVNLAKWESAEQYCLSHGLEFKIITERSVYG